jgi:hypothetical protein
MAGLPGTQRPASQVQYCTGELMHASHDVTAPQAAASVPCDTERLAMASWTALADLCPFDRSSGSRTVKPSSCS